MTELDSFEEFVATGNYGSSTVIQACRYLIAVQTDDLPVTAMHDELLQNTDLIATENFQTVSTDVDLLEKAALAALSLAWQSADGPETVTGCFAAARRKLPVIEMGIAATTVMYSVYLIVTRNVKKKETVIERRKDGTLKIRTTLEFYSPIGPLGAIVKHIRPTKSLPPTDPNSSTDSKG